jgi:hypothetical protein
MLFRPSSILPRIIRYLNPDNTFSTDCKESISMLFEKFILYLAWFISVVSFLLFIPHKKQRHAQFAFLVMQFITWFLGLIVAHLNLIVYPVRFFPNINGTSFTFEFLAYPVICAFFNEYYPISKDNFIKFCYYIIICSVITGLELIFENHTQLIKYINWTGYHTWISVFITLYISRLYYRWFLKIL